MKNTLFILLDIIFLFTGIALIPINFNKWKGMGFEITSKAEIGASFNGNAYLMMIVVGVALICYAVFDFLIFRKSTKSSVINNTNHE